MNLPVIAPEWLYFLLLACLAAAAVEDAARLRISNVTSAAVALLAIASILIAGPDWGLWQNLMIFAAILAIGTAAFAKGMLGGGDVKLLAAVGLWAPLKLALPLLGAIFLAGGVIAVLAMLFWQFRKSGASSMKTRRIPYGLAIALGTASVFHSARF